MASSPLLPTGRDTALWAGVPQGRRPRRARPGRSRQVPRASRQGRPDHRQRVLRARQPPPPGAPQVEAPGGTGAPSPTQAPCIDIAADVQKIRDVAREHSREGRSIAEISVGAVHPLIGKRRLGEESVKTAIDAQHVREALDLIAREARSVRGRGVGTPAVDRAARYTEEGCALRCAETPRIRDAKEATKRAARTDLARRAGSLASGGSCHRSRRLLTSGRVSHFTLF